MVVIDKRTNQFYYLSTRTEVAELVGVNRITVARWRAKRMDDKTYTEEYNFFTIVFNVLTKVQK